MIDRIRPYPVLMSFLAFFGGILSAGMMGTAHAVLVCIALASGAWVVIRLRGLLIPGTIPALLLFFLVGSLSLGARESGQHHVRTMWPPGISFEKQSGRRQSSFIVTVKRVVGRNLSATRAIVELKSVRVDEEWLDYPSGTEAALYVRGLADLLEGWTYMAQGRLIPPRRQDDAVSARWPGRVSVTSLRIRSTEHVFPVGSSPENSHLNIDRWRLLLAKRLTASLREDAADFALAILLGESGGIDHSLRSDLSSLGTAHVLAVSGLHVASAALVVAFLATLVLGPLLARFMPGAEIVRVRLAASVGAAFLMAQLAGMTPSAQRAAVMVAVTAAGAVSNRRQGLEGLAGLAGLGSLLLEPRDAFSLSFVLSYSAILGIAAMTQPITQLLRKLFPVFPHWILTAAGCSISATLATLPVTLLAFGTAGVPGPLINLMVLPLMALLIMPVAMAVLVALAVWPVMPVWLLEPVQWIFTSFLAGQVTLSGFLPQTGFLASGPSLWLCLTIVSGSIGLLVGRRPALGVLGGSCGLAIAISFGPSQPEHPNRALIIGFLNAGKGDAILVRCPGGADYLVDTADRDRVDGFGGIAGSLIRAGITSLEGVIVTHGDSDHCGGLEKLSRRVRIGEVVVPCQEAVREPLRGMLARLSRKGIQSRCVTAGMEAMPGCRAHNMVMWPPPFRDLSSNAASMVLKLTWSKRSILLTGDLGSKQESELVAAGMDIGADVLKLAHHGSKGSSSRAFLLAVSPSLAVVSGFVGGNNMDVPEEVRGRVTDLGASILSSSKMNGVTVMIHNNAILIKQGSP